jgi:hypothetical protein
MQRLVSSCTALAAREEFRRIGNLRSIDCVATRLWFDRHVPTQFPANVLSGFEECTGATWFNLNDLQVPNLAVMLPLLHLTIASFGHLSSRTHKQLP